MADPSGVLTNRLLQDDCTDRVLWAEKCIWKDSCMAVNIRVESQSRQILSRKDSVILRVCIVSLACFAVATISGCGLMANAIYIVKGIDAPAEFDDLKDKRVAVIVSTSAGLNADASGILMSRHINELLARNVKKIEMVNPEEVDHIISDQPLDDRSISVIGSRLRVDYVLLVDVANLKLRDGQTLFKGRSNTSVTAYKVSEGERAVFKKSFPEFVYPQHGAPVTDFDEATFQRIYLSELALRVARTFYPYDPSIDVAKDAAVSSLGALQ